MSKPKIIFRANGSKQIGLGHLVRCSALSSLLKNDFETTLIVRSDLPNSIAEIKNDFHNLQQIDSLTSEQELNLLLNFKDALLVLDGYDFDSSYQQKLKSKSKQLVCIDDVHRYSFMASVVINHTGGLKPTDYTTPPWTQFYLGPAYAILRKPFFGARKKRLTPSKNQKLFICLGGSDPNNHTLQVLTEAVAYKKFSAYQIVVGNGYQHLEQLQRFIETQNSLLITVHQGVSADAMVTVMQSCMYAICSPSSVAYEYLAVGSVLFLVQTADNQVDLHSYLISSQLAFDWRSFSQISDLQITDCVNRNQTVFDGKQEDRLRNIFVSLHAQQHTSIRPATSKDISVCFAWANDPEVRINSYIQEPILWETHVAWFNSRLSDQHCYFYILEHEGLPMAQIRFHIQEQTAVLNFMVDARYRGKSYGSMVVSMGIRKFIEDFDKPITINAQVKSSNLASQRAFEKMLFEKQVSTEQRESFTYLMAYHGSASWK